MPETPKPATFVRLTIYPNAAEARHVNEAAHSARVARSEYVRKLIREDMARAAKRAKA